MDNLGFFITTMPKTRPADYFLGCLEGSVFMDFDNHVNGRISLKRISFDGYGCCDLSDEAIPMNDVDSRAFKETVESLYPDQSKLAAIIKKTLVSNRDLIWEDALNEYGLVEQERCSQK